MSDKNKRLPKLLIIFISAAVLVSLAVIVLVVFKVDTISFEGSTHYTDEQLSQYIFHGKENLNTLIYFIMDNKKKHETIPFVQEYDIEVVWPHGLKVSVYEKEIIGYIKYMGCNMYFDRDGIIVDSSQDVLEGVPEVSGINYENIVLYSRLDTKEDKVFPVMLDVMQLFDKYGILVDKVYFDTSLNVTVYTGNIKVMLGGSDTLTERVHELSQMMPKLEGRSGTLYLNSFTDDTKAVIFKADADNAQNNNTSQEEAKTAPVNETQSEAGTAGNVQ